MDTHSFLLILGALLGAGAVVLVGLVLRKLEKIREEVTSARTRSIPLLQQTVTLNQTLIAEIRSLRMEMQQDWAQSLPDDSVSTRTSVGEFKERKILILDDDPSTCSMLSTMLQRLGHRAVVTRRGNDAVTAWRRAVETGDPFDIAIFDLIIPGSIGGRDVWQQLRIAGERHLKVVACSGYIDDTIHAELIAEGFSHILSKPFQLQSLGEMIRQL
ncbi:CheY chemotaxis protein or a CheY-like REC (receiver) domain [Verrucomicrobium sp. GAS474]|uniref:response regulator n=1 Tax=Verrucomicrobium sp. GAS474 TaxID=1882831 RepID=UPI000879A431|nr:response regulator [Verrucomicrobium sp. GAS474]SDU04782.1 CheY chemotaxis protein or a CheY-like REC (receiver) domain [Verrucomicrobium sp. GAS474]